MRIFNAIICSSILTLCTVHGLSFQLGTTPGHQCYYITLSSQQKSSGSFEVISGGDSKVTVQISGPDAQLQVRDIACSPRQVSWLGRAPHMLTLSPLTPQNMYNEQCLAKGVWEVVAPVTGEYTICFSQYPCAVAPKQVDFSIHTDDQLFENLVHKSRVTRLEEEVLALHEVMTNVMDGQEYMRTRERASRYVLRCWQREAATAVAARLCVCAAAMDLSPCMRVDAPGIRTKLQTRERCGCPCWKCAASFSLQAGKSCLSSHSLSAVQQCSPP